MITLSKTGVLFNSCTSNAGKKIRLGWLNQSSFKRLCISAVTAVFVSSVCAQQPPEVQPVTWKTGTNLTAGVDGALSKTSGGSTAWNAGVTANQALLGDGYLQFKAKPSSQFIIGLNLIDAGTTAAEIEHGIYIQPSGTSTTQGIAVVYQGAAGTSLGTFTSATTFEIRRTGVVIEYLKDGVVLETSTVPSVGRVLIDTAFYKQNSELTQSLVNDGDLDNDGMADSWERDYLPANSTWAQLVGFSAAGDFDGDGVSNLQEYGDITDPMDSLSTLWIALAS